MIDKAKQYRTRAGKEVRILGVDEGREWPVHASVKFAAVWHADLWIADRWDMNGRWHGGGYPALDLVEVNQEKQQ